MGSHFGTLFRISTWGESHGAGIGVVLDGCPARLPLGPEDIQGELDRRRPGQSKITTQRKEADQVEILSGVSGGYTLGTPIALWIRNTDHRPSAYKEMREAYRPSHADLVYDAKYGHRAVEGGGRSSARETAARVAAGAVARKLLQVGSSVQVRAYLTRVHDIEAPPIEALPSLEAVEATPVRCPHPETAARMIERIRQVQSEGDSVGGVIECRIHGLPRGLGAPVFDRFEADLGKAMLSLPATKGFEVGSGFAGTLQRGSEHNDRWSRQGEDVTSETNRAGGVLGGITSGEPVIFRIAFKPTATILQSQPTLDRQGQPTEIQGKGRHDPCVVPRAVPIVEAMTALVTVDHWMRQTAQADTFKLPLLPDSPLVARQNHEAQSHD